MSRSAALRHAHRLQQRFKSIAGANDAALVFAIRVAAAVLAYGVQILLARTLHLSEYGIYVTLWTWMIVLNHIATFGFSESALRFMPRYAEREKAALVQGFYSTGYRVVMLGTAFLAAAGVLSLNFLGDWLPPAYLIPVVVVLMGLPITAVEIYLEGVSRAMGWFALAIVPPYVVRPALIAAGAVLLHVSGLAPDAASVLAIAILVTAASAIFQTLVIRRRLAREFGHARPAPPQRLWLAASLPLMLVVAADEILMWSDILAMGFLLPPEEVSVYFVVQRSMSLAAFVQFAFMLVMARDFSVANARRNRDELQYRVTRSCSFTFWLTIPAVALTLAAGYPLLALFGSEFPQGYAALCVLGLAFILRAVVGQAQELTIVLGHERANVFISTICIGVNVAGCILLVPHLGILGGAISTALTYALRTVAYVIAVRHMAGLWALPYPLSPARRPALPARTDTPIEPLPKLQQAG